MMVVLVSVVLGLVGALHGDPEVVGLVAAQLGHVDAQGAEVGGRHLLVQLLGQHEHAHLVVLGPAPQLNLGQNLRKIFFVSDKIFFVLI